MPSFVFTWKIENFLATRKPLITPDLTIKSFHESNWNLEVDPNNFLNSIWIFLQRLKDNGPEALAIGYEFVIVAADGSRMNNQKTEQSEIRKESGFNIVFCEQNDLLTNRNFYFPNNSFTVECHIWPCSAREPLFCSYKILTIIGTEKFSFKKSIKNFSSHYSGNPVIIRVPSQINLEIILKVENSSDEYLTVHIRKLEEVEDLFLICKLSLLDVQGFPQDTKEAEYLFQNKEEESWTFPPFIKIHSLKLNEKFVLNDDTLLLHCEMTTSTGEEMLTRIVKQESLTQISDDRTVLINNFTGDMERAYLEKKFCDIQLKSEGVSFPAHRVVLSARSSVFDAMLRNDMVETKTGVVDITDIDATTLGEMLIFIYSGDIKELKYSSAMKLFSAADKYQILSLRDKCSSFLRQNMNARNACEILQLADMHGDTVLKSAAEEIICFKCSEVLSSDAWNNLIV